MNEVKEITYPGIHPLAEEVICSNSFTEIEKKICSCWKQEWYITFAQHLENGNSKCNYIVAKPTDRLQEVLGISKEIVVIISDFSNFEARSLDFFDIIYTKFPSKNRLEKICYAFISACDDIENEIAKYLSSQESQIVIPFSYKTFSTGNGSQTIQNQFRKYFYSRDLFGINDPLKKEYYFFARDNISMDIIAKHKGGQNAGLFGLRKTGKTSIIFDIIRKSANCDVQSIYIDCQNTSFNMRRWNTALYYSLQIAYNQSGQNLLLSEDQFSEDQAAKMFEQGICELSSALRKTILLLFDEIENITPSKSSSPTWCSGLDFVYFWQSIRSSFQETSDIFTYCILGTNPMCVETSSFFGKDNPIYNAFIPQYIPGFNQPQTREMVRKLGRLMGLKFDEEVYTHLTEEYGGHPFLMRQICSSISRKYPMRPVQIDRLKYNTVKTEFNRESNYFGMLLEVLVQFYPDEYEMLKLLATDDYETFKEFAVAEYSMIAHLKGYSIIKINDDGSYDFRMDALKEFIVRTINKPVLSKTTDEQWKEICSSRNTLEVEMRKMVKTVLRFSYHSEADAKNHVVSKLYGKSIEGKKATAKTYNELFDSKVNRIYLKNLHTLIKANYAYFQEFLGDQEKFNLAMDILIDEGRFDAHAKTPTNDDIDAYNVAIKRVKTGIEKFKESMA